MKPQVLLSWSSGKDCAWTLHNLLKRDDVDVIGLLTTFNEVADRVSMHAVRHELVRAQANAAGLPLWPVLLPWPCTNSIYAERMESSLNHARDQGITHIAFGDLFLEDIRQYRIRQLAPTGIQPLFPSWTSPDKTPSLAKDMLNAGIRAVITCIDPNKLDPSFVGREFDEALLKDLPPHVDPCGENGEFHTFCYNGPMFTTPIPIRIGRRLEREGFWYADILPPADRS